MKVLPWSLVASSKNRERGASVMPSVNCVVLLALLLWTGAGVEGRKRRQDVEKLYETAVALRSSLEASPKDGRRATEMLLEAAGMTYDQLRHPSVIPANVTIHSGVLRELSLALEVGRGVGRNELLAMQFMRRAAELGDALAHGEMFVRHAFGFFNESSYVHSKLASFFPGDTAMSMLHATFGAFGNDSVSQMVLGYRHMIGHGVPHNCPTAAAYYNSVAEKVINLAKLPGALPLIEKTRLDLRNGYHKTRPVNAEQWLQYFQYSADLGDVKAQTKVGELYNFGSHGIKKDHKQAFQYLQKAADAGDATAMGHLGHMYANGLGVPQDNETAFKLFKKAADNGNAEGHYGLGYMYLTGYGTEKNESVALSHFNKAKDHVESQFSLGVMHLKGIATRTSPSNALNYFTAASSRGHLLAEYNLAMMYLAGIGIAPNCNAALRLLKKVAERGPWGAALQQGHDAFQNGDYTHALVSYLRAAQMGYEYGQSNAAWMLEHGLSPGRISQNIHMALGLYKWSAEQENTESLLAVGDILYYGRGIDKDWKRAAGIYRLAEKQGNPRAAFNLGFMYQYGAGLPKDHHLAKRYYDMAIAYNADAYYACKLSLAFLTMHSWWDNARPRFPAALRFWIDPLFVCKYQNASHVPPGWWSSRKADRLKEPSKGSLFDTLMDFLDLDAISDRIQDFVESFAAEDAGDLMETVFLVTLILAFVAVYRRRRRNRGRQQANLNAQDAHPVVANPVPEQPPGGDAEPRGVPQERERDGADGLAPAPEANAEGNG